MTIHSNLSSTRFPLASAPATEKPAAANSSDALARLQQATTHTQPSPPAGLVGHNVNTTA
nr:hypothetical protein [Paraburkholderia ribeironis]